MLTDHCPMGQPTPRVHTHSNPCPLSTTLLLRYKSRMKVLRGGLHSWSISSAGRVCLRCSCAAHLSSMAAVSRAVSCTVNISIALEGGKGERGL
ncbi:hypothetical protein GDO81_024506 [Engystomops pustulosus]|uniref:Uncharacterized protein n=1 Tax=Engystomops pustulosus TaxID=76066 RepID=A0AAV6YQL1_ENGPU|nr:hypothetical protein GDO81_024506 [Engystomops pustulosus]